MWRIENLSFRANLCNATVIDMHGDIIQVSHGFEGCQMLEYIAAITTGDQRTVDDNITNVLRPLICPTLLELSRVLGQIASTQYLVNLCGT